METEEKRRNGAWRANAALCELLAFSFRYPTKELADAVRSGEWLEALEEIASASGLVLDDRTLKEASDASGEEWLKEDALFHRMRVEATRLFVGAPNPAVSPYEGVWRSRKEGIEALLFVNPYAMKVEKFIRSCGLGQPNGSNEPLDSVSTELELLQYLALVEGGSIVPERTSPVDFPGGSAASAYALFVEEHASLWMPEFCDALVSETRIPFYKAAGTLLRSFIVSQQGGEKSTVAQR